MSEAALMQEVLRMAGRRKDLHLSRCLTGKFRSIVGNRIIEAGVKGAPDLMGWVWHLVTPEDMGLLLPVSVGIELKGTSGRLRNGQREYLGDMRRMGCKAGVARSRGDVDLILDQPPGVNPALVDGAY